MGMFDYVHYPSKCPWCGAHVFEFQTKDGDCALDILDAGMVRTFYTDCPECHKWIEYEVEPPKNPVIKLVPPERSSFPNE